jgi:hypothetical protein
MLEQAEKKAKGKQRTLAFLRTHCGRRSSTLHTAKLKHFFRKRSHLVGAVVNSANPSQKAGLWRTTTVTTQSF